jgi:hypothetical protein
MRRRSATAGRSTPARPARDGDRRGADLRADPRRRRRAAPGLRAIGLELVARGSIAQVSCNVGTTATPLAAVVDAVARHADVAECELVGSPRRQRSTASRAA